MRKEGVSMKKMLAKAVALSLVLGGVGFVANDAHAADIGLGVGVHSAGISSSKGYDVKTDKKLPDKTVLAEQKDLEAVNKEAAYAKTTAEAAQAAAANNAKAIEANSKAISAETGARKNADEELDKKLVKIQRQLIMK